MHKGLKLYFEKDGNFKAVFDAKNAKELKEILRKGRQPDVLLIEIKPEIQGIEMIKWLHEAHPQIRIIVFTDCETELTIAELYLLKAKAVLEKNISPEELLKAIRTVEESGHYANDSHSRRLLKKLDDDSNGTKGLKPLLTETEKIFLKGILEGKSYKEIAGILKTTEGAIDNLRSKLFEKLEVESKEAMALKAKENCLEEE